jgi:2-keto-4-pentenoate hydratase/2-oxohepta-3-ene-1,7-dioic acid hydratase in catechol pathway
MKFLRFIDPIRGKPCAGILVSADTVECLDGDGFDADQATGIMLPLGEIKHFLPPVVPPTILALGLNYRQHAIETGAEIPSEPLLFIKAASAANAHGEPIVLPQQAPEYVDYEAELVIVIGKTCRNVSPEAALDYVFGYTCGNDVSARDCQKWRDKQWARAKSFDTFAVMGPVIETDLDPADLRIRCWLNGECMQDSRTSDLIFDVPATISYLSNAMTLYPGTVIFTGTPPGVGVAREPEVYLRDQDRVRVEIEGVGSLENPVLTGR